MKVDWSNSIALLNPLYEQFKSAQNLTAITYNGQNIPKEDIENSLKQSIEMMQYKLADVEGLPYAIHYPGVTNSLQNMIVQFPNLLSSNGAQPYGDQFIGSLWGLYASLIGMSSETIKLEQLDKLLNENTAVKTKLKELSSYNESLKNALLLANGKIQSLDEASSKADELLKVIEQSNHETSNLKTSAQSNAVDAKSAKDKVDELLKDVSAKNTNLETLISQIALIKQEAEDTLGLTSQSALATSFSRRKSSLEKAQYVWAFIFIAGLAFLFKFTANSIATPEEFNFPPIIIEGKLDLWGAIVRLLLSGPLIWLTWFSVKQFNNNVALIEDYAFKEASALAFVGYKNDMKSDDEMVKLLSESAIKNFSYAPSRLISSNDSASPMHDLFESALKDQGLFDKLMEVLKALKPSRD